MSQIIEKPVPYNYEAEEAVLGSLLIDRDAIITVAPFLKASDFHREQHQWIYEAFLSLYFRREPGDFVTLCNELDRIGRLEDSGGVAYLTSLVNSVPTAVHVEYYGHIVERCSILRNLIKAGGEIAALGYEDEANLDTVLDEAEQKLFAVTERQTSAEFVHIRKVLETYFDRMDAIHQNRGEIIGVPTGFHDLDQLTGGLQKSDLVIIAARPSAGKTSLALSICHHVAVHHHSPVGIFSLEMSQEQLVHRLLAMETGVDSQRLRLGFMDEDEWVEVSKAFGRLAEAPIYIDDTAGVSSTALRSKARRLQAEARVSLIVVDYLQLMSSGRTDNRVQEISEISRGLKALARELDVPVLALSQLSRAVESRQSHVPMLSDLRESGSIEQDADVVMFIYRDEMYNPDSERKGIAEIHVSKHRNGPVGMVPLRFFERTTRFADLELYHQPE